MQRPQLVQTVSANDGLAQIRSPSYFSLMLHMFR